MLRIFALLIGLVIASSPASAGAYGTIVHKDGSMTALYKSNKSLRTYVAQFNKKGQMQGSCARESMAAYQTRKAYMKAQSKWRAGYVPRKFPCKRF